MPTQRYKEGIQLVIASANFHGKVVQIVLKIGLCWIGCGFSFARMSQGTALNFVSVALAASSILQGCLRSLKLNVLAFLACDCGTPAPRPAPHTQGGRYCHPAWILPRPLPEGNGRYAKKKTTTVTLRGDVNLQLVSVL